ncbi:MAG: M20/M25/M40 family metallo-hydrolase, partial [Gemmatimonadetes bacterium]|nr:M20/M25/M40 family metallo-hydrolase [Gemmatimonadota bacterium]
MKPTPSLAPAEAEVLRAIDESRLLRTLAGLIAIPSWDGHERRAQEYIAEAMGGLGMEVDIWEIDEDRLRGHPDYATEIERRDPLGVVGRARWGDGGRTLVLNGHVDVVPPGDLSRWATPPFEMVRQGGRVYGRGVVDMKGPLVAGLAGV